LTQATCEAFTKLVRQAKSCLLGNLPVDLTEQWITAGNDAGTYMALGPGSRQWRKLEEFQPHALYMNFEEAQQVTGLEDEEPEAVFSTLVERCQARHAIVMTGGGVQPTHVADLITGQNEQIAPVSLTTIPDRRVPANCLGTGDVMAGTVTFLLGLQEELLAGEDLFEVVRFGQDLALLHLTESEAWAERVREQYVRLRDRLASRLPALPDAQRAA
jgi:sugar/nucleoside kinase (ribokinase family)